MEISITNKLSTNTLQILLSLRHKFLNITFKLPNSTQDKLFLLNIYAFQRNVYLQYISEETLIKVQHFVILLD